MLGLLFTPLVYGFLFSDDFRLFKDKAATQLVGEKDGRLIMMSLEEAKGLNTIFTLRDARLQIGGGFACVKSNIYNIYRWLMRPNEIGICDSPDKATEWDIQERPDAKVIVKNKNKTTCMGYSPDSVASSPLREVDCLDAGYNTLFDLRPGYELAAALDSMLLNRSALGIGSRFSSSSYSAASGSSFGSRKTFN